jgi:cytidine deaminase
MSPSDIAAKLVAPAMQARENGRHYSGFKVGCMGCGSGGEIFHGANLKLTKESSPVCAEEFVMQQAEEAGVLLDVMVVTGRPRDEDTTPTLHCCGERCRPAMRRRIREGRAIKPDTHLTFVNSETGHIEEFTIESLMQAHGESLDD